MHYSCEILLAEDNAADVKLVQQALALHNVACKLHVVEDGAEALAFLEQLEKDPHPRFLDLLVLDLRLPKHDGEEVLRRLRGTERLGLTPVVVMTGADSPALKANIQKLAALHYFEKPFDPVEFMRLGGIIRDILVARGRHSPPLQSNA